MEKLSVGLANRASAYRSSKWGGFACLSLAALMMIGTIATLIVEPEGLLRAAAHFVGASLIPIVLAVAGTRLLRGEGLVWGIAAATILAVDIVIYFPQQIALLTMISVVVKVSAFLLIGNGVRGALAIRNADNSNGWVE
jgi:hypothetical protein